MDSSPDGLGQALPSPSRSIFSPAKSTDSSVTTPSRVQSPMKFGIRNIFDSKVFCVYGPTIWKADLESKIRKLGGAISQSPDVPDLFCIVGQRNESPRIQRAIKSQKYDIISSTWVLKCKDQGKEVPLELDDYWGITKETKKSLEVASESYSKLYSQNTITDKKEEIREKESLSLLPLVDGSPVPSPSHSSKGLSSSSSVEISSFTTPVKSLTSGSGKESTPQKNDSHDVDMSSSSSDTDYEMEGNEMGPRKSAEVAKVTDNVASDTDGSTDFSGGES